MLDILAFIVGTISLILSLNIVIQAKKLRVAVSRAMGALQQRSVEKRIEKNFQEAMLTDFLNSQNPILGMILEQFPTAKEYIMKYPQLIPYLLKFLGNLGGLSGDNQQTKSLNKSSNKHKIWG